MTIWTRARVMPEHLVGKNLPDTFYTFLIKRDGVVVGSLKYDRGRWKSAGGPAWQGTITGNFGGCRGISFHSKDRSKVLEWFKDQYDAVVTSHAVSA